MTKMEEHMIEISKNEARVTSPESELTGELPKICKAFKFLTKSFLVADQVGSPLSISLASSDGCMSISLRSTSELRNIQPLVIGNPGPSSANFDPQSVIYPSSVQPTLQRQQSIHDDVPMTSNAPASSQNPIQRKK